MWNNYGLPWETKVLLILDTEEKSIYTITETLNI